MNHLPDDPKLSFKLSACQIRALSLEVTRQLEQLVYHDGRLAYIQVLTLSQLRRIDRYLARRWHLISYGAKKAGTVSLELSSVYLLHWLILNDRGDDDLLHAIGLIDHTIKNYPYSYRLILRR